MKLADALLDAMAHDAPVGCALGVVTDTSPFTIQINGDPTDIPSPPRNADYTPTLGDRVFVLRPGASLFVVGQIA